MRKLIYSMSPSLDGYVADQDGNFDWAAPDEELHRFHNEQTRQLGLHLLGRRLYEIMTYWETAEERNPSAPQHELEFARIWKALPKIVFSNTLTTVEGNTTLSRRDPVEEVRALKEQPGEDVGVGGVALAASLTAHGLIDEYHLFINPLVLGGGKAFFARDQVITLDLIETRTFSSRVVYLRYGRV
jgi:dihydrofolate reductase